MSNGSREDKVALLLKHLPEPMTANVLSQLAPVHAARLRALMQRMDQTAPPKEAIDQVLSDFGRILEAAGRDSPQSAPAAEKPAASPPPAVPKPAASAAATNGKPTDQNDPLAGLYEIPIDRLVAALKDEAPRTVSIVLSYLEATRAGTLLKGLASELRKQVSAQLAKRCSVNAEILERIARALALKSQQSREVVKESTGDAKFQRIADMLRLLDKTERNEMLTALTEEDEATATRVREFLYRFDDFLRIESRSMQKLLAEIDSKTLAVALKGASEAITEKVLANLSKRARESLTEEGELLGTLAPAQVDQARKAVVEIIQRLDQAGDLIMT
jgi:flagellar motor switch protein FliG